MGVTNKDERNLEVVALGLPLYNGAQLAVDVTLRSALTSTGEARPKAAEEGGSVAEAARRDKETAYPELVFARRCKLVMVALETGGRWSSEAAEFVKDLADAKAKSAPKTLRFSASLAWQRRWVRLLSTAAAKAFVHSLVSPVGALHDFASSAAPELFEVVGRD